MSVRLVNVGQEEVMHPGQVVGMAFPEFVTALTQVTQEDNNNKKNVTGYQVDSNSEHSKSQEARELLEKFSDVFRQDGDQLTTIQTDIQHELHLKADSAPQRSRPRRLAPDVRKEVRGEVTYLMKQRLIRESTSPWASPIVAARRKNSKLRPAIDYRRLNAVSQQQYHPLPLTQWTN